MTETGTWWNEDYSRQGTWSTSEDDPSMKYDSTVYDDDLWCEDTIFGFVDANGNSWCDYFDENYDECSSTSEEAEYAAVHCCSCGGGKYTN